MKRLNAGPWVPRSGKHPWSASVVHHILSDPVYTGTAYANRFRFAPPKKPRRPPSLGGAAPTCRHLKPREEWIPIPVPALIDEETAARAQAQLARNARLSWRHTPKYSYLLRCLLTCGVCGLAMFGTCHKATATQAERRYYKCHGKDPIMSAREQRCPRRIVKAEDLDAAVWQHVVALLSDPAALLAQFAQYTHLTEEGDLPAQAATRDLATRLARIEREDRRLLDAYQAEVISLEELAHRRQMVAERRQAVLAQKEEQDRLRQERAHALVVLQDLTAFCTHIQGRLATATFADKQAILQLLIERIIVGDDTLEIRHVIPLRGFDGPPGSAEGPLCGLRSDGMRLAALPTGALEVRLDRLDEPAMVVGDDHIDAPQAAALEAGEEVAPTRR
jgi:site-specific DNA recombinase